MLKYFSFDTLIMCSLLLLFLVINKKFAKHIVKILEVVLVLMGNIYILSHYKDITILQMIITYNPVQPIVNVLLRINIKPSGALSQFSTFTLNEIVRIVIVSIQTKFISPVKYYMYVLRERLIKIFHDLGLCNLEDTYYNLCA